MCNANDRNELYYKVIDEVGDREWSRFARYLGCDYPSKNGGSQEEKCRQLECWWLKMGCFSGDKASLLHDVEREVHGSCNKRVCSEEWPAELHKRREIAVILYNVIIQYGDNDEFWMKEIVTKKLRMRDKVNAMHNDYTDSVERKYMLLDAWRRRNELKGVQELRIALHSLLGFTEDSTESIREALRERALRVSNDIGTPMSPSQAIEAVTLQILKNPKTSPEDLDFVGQYTTRQEALSIHDCPKGDIVMDQLFQYATGNAENNFRLGYGRPLSQKEYIATHGNNVLVTGQAGIGKTTLTKMLTKLILNHNKNLPATEYFFYLRIRDIDFSRTYTLMELLITAGCIELEYNEEISRELLKHLRKSKLTLFFDGIDEGDTSRLAQRAPVCDPFHSTDPQVILANLMSGKLLPEAKKLWTSRQRQAYELHETIRPHTVVQVMGLDAHAREELGKQLCSEEWWPEVKEYLDSHLDVKAICYVPVMCIISMIAVHTSLQKRDNARLSTVTDVLTYALKMYSKSDHLRDRQGEISKIPHLAWKGYIEKKIIFTEKDFKDAKISSDGFEAFIKTELSHSADVKVKLFTGEKRSSFSHYIWQELFAAIRALMYTPSADFEPFVPHFTEARWEVVVKLMFGICDPMVERRLLEFLTDCCFSDFERNKQFLKKLLTSQVEHLRRPVNTGDEIGEYLQTLLQISSWIGEARPEISVAESGSQTKSLPDPLGILQDVLPNLPDTIHFGGSLLPSDVSSVLFILPNRHTITVGSLSSVNFRGASLEMLCREIPRKELQVSELILSENNNIKNIKSSFCGCLRFVKKLSLTKCKIDAETFKAICQAIADRETEVDYFDLSHTKLNVFGARYLANCVHNIASLNINSCDFDAAMLDALSRKISQRKNPLHLGYTNIDNKAAVGLCKCLHEISFIAFARCGILDQGFKTFTSTIRGLKRPIDEIILSTNISQNNDLSKMTDDEKAREVASCLKNVQKLTLNCWITARGAQSLATSLGKRCQPMTLLDVSGNKFGDKGARAFIPVLQNVKLLKIDNCNVSEDVKRLVSECHSQQWCLGNSSQDKK